MVKTPAVSIIVPTHNRAELIGRTVQSILNQTLADFELIIVDDASVDHTEEVIKGFRDLRIRYVKQERNSGGARARNVGIDMACGAYIAFLDSDDTWLPRHLEERLEMLRTRLDIGGVMGGLVIKGNDREVIPKEQHIIVGSDRMATHIFKGKGGAQTSTFVISSRACKEVRFDERLRKHQDWDFAIRLAGYAKLLVISNGTCIVDRGDHTRMSNSIDHKATLEFLNRYSPMVGREIAARLRILMAELTLLSEGKNENYRAYLRDVPIFPLEHGLKLVIKNIVLRAPFLGKGILRSYRVVCSLI